MPSVSILAATLATSLGEGGGVCSYALRAFLMRPAAALCDLWVDVLDVSAEVDELTGSCDLLTFFEGGTWSSEIVALEVELFEAEGDLCDRELLGK